MMFHLALLGLPAAVLATTADGMNDTLLNHRNEGAEQPFLATGTNVRFWDNVKFA